MVLRPPCTRTRPGATLNPPQPNWKPLRPVLGQKIPDRAGYVAAPVAVGRAVLRYLPEVRTIIYTTDAIASLNMRLCKIIKNRGHFPTDEAATKLLYLALRNIEKIGRCHHEPRSKPLTSSPSCFGKRFTRASTRHSKMAPRTKFLTGPLKPKACEVKLINNTSTTWTWLSSSK